MSSQPTRPPCQYCCRHMQYLKTVNNSGVVDPPHSSILLPILIDLWCVRSQCQKIFGQLLTVFLGLIFFSFLSCKLNSYLRHISTFFFFFSSERMQKLQVIQHQSHRVLFLCKSTQLRVYIRYKITLFYRVTSVLFSSLFVLQLRCQGFSNFLLRKTLWPFFWGGTVVGTEYKAG